MNEENEVLNSNTLVERIKNCIDVSSRKKNMPIMIRKDSNLMEIIDTSLENDVLYIDVQDMKYKEEECKDKELKFEDIEFSMERPMRRSRRQVEPVMSGGLLGQLQGTYVTSDITWDDIRRYSLAGSAEDMNAERPMTTNEAIGANDITAWANDVTADVGVPTNNGGF